MNTTIEQRKEVAIKCMNTLDIFKPYIKSYSESNKVCFFENYAGFWAYQEPEIAAKIKELEEEHNCTVYGITHEYTEFGECYSFLIVTDYEEEWNNLLVRDGYTFYAFAYVWNKTDEWCSEFGTIGVSSRFGGLKRVA